MLRYTAALPPRDDLDSDAYRAWAELDADSPSFRSTDAGPACGTRRTRSCGNSPKPGLTQTTNVLPALPITRSQ